MKSNKILLVIASGLAITLLGGCKKSGNSSSLHTENGEYTVTFDKDNQLDGGEIVKNDIIFHFDENAVNEHPSNCFIEIGPYGSLYLENYIPGLTGVKVTAVHTVDYSGELSLGTSSTPNSVEYYSIYSSTSSHLTLYQDKPYFSVHNHAGNNLLIEKIEITGKKEAEDPEKALKDKIKLSNIIKPYTPGMNADPYEGRDIDPKDIPSNRIVKKINEGKTYSLPGNYTYGYEVYNKTKDGNIGKLMYCSKATFSFAGSQAYGKCYAIFHTASKDIILDVNENQQVDISKNTDLLDYNWNSPINDFTTAFTSNREYFQVFSVVGMPSEKDGDGCFPVSTKYTLLEKSFTMPDPIMMPGYKFGGWYMDHELTKPFDPDGEYESDLTLYAKCIETEEEFRKVYYHDYDGSFLNRVDILYENKTISLPTFDEIKTALKTRDLMYDVKVGTNRIGMLRPENDYSQTGHCYGDKLSYDMIKTYSGDVHLYVSKIAFYYDGPGEFTRIFEDTENNTVISGYRMGESYFDGDYILPSRYIKVNRSTWDYDFGYYSDPMRGDEFMITDEVHGYLLDQGSFNSIASYGYGTKNEVHAKPLSGILRHESVLKVGRRAFFNRYGLEGTYFPRNAREFDIESYANTEFNDYLLLPKSLQKINQRAFIGSKNIKFVALPKSLTSVGKDAFSLGDYDAATNSFINIKNRERAVEKITFFYEGSEADYARLNEETRNEIEKNASKIIFNYQYSPYYGR